MLQILQDGDKRLLKKAKRIDKIDDTIRNIAASMVETMLANNGVGLAGNQIGLLKRIIVILVNGNPKVMINPEIILMSDNKVTEDEGCLSFPDTFLPIERFESIRIKYRSLSGHPMLETYNGLEARIIQHELDHLEGIVFTTRK